MRYCQATSVPTGGGKVEVDQYQRGVFPCIVGTESNPSSSLPNVPSRSPEITHNRNLHRLTKQVSIALGRVCFASKKRKLP